MNLWFYSHCFQLALHPTRNYRLSSTLLISVTTIRISRLISATFFREADLNVVRPIWIHPRVCHIFSNLIPLLLMSSSWISGFVSSPQVKADFDEFSRHFYYYHTDCIWVATAKPAEQWSASISTTNKGNYSFDYFDRNLKDIFIQSQINCRFKIICIMGNLSIKRDTR